MEVWGGGGVGINAYRSSYLGETSSILLCWLGWCVGVLACCSSRRFFVVAYSSAVVVIVIVVGSCLMSFCVSVMIIFCHFL